MGCSVGLGYDACGWNSYSKMHSSQKGRPDIAAGGTVRRQKIVGFSGATTPCQDSRIRILGFAYAVASEAAE